MRISIWLPACAVAFAALTLVFCSDDDGTDDGTEPVVVDLTGQWDGTYDQMALYHTGSSLRGVYEYRCGQIAGTVSGTHVTFQWWENAPGLPYDSAPVDARGDGWFDVTAGGDSLVGKWRFEGAAQIDRDWIAGRLSTTPDSTVIHADCVPDTGDTTAVGVVDTGPPPPAGMLRSTDTTDDLLFQIADGAGEAIYYRGHETPDSTQLTHITYRDSAANLYGAIMHDFLCVQWVLEGLSIAVHRSDSAAAEPFDPTLVEHEYMSDTLEDSLIVDIYPSDLDTTLARLERLTGRTFPGAREYLVVTGILTFDEIRAEARTMTGDARRKAIAAATAFGMAQSACAIAERFTGLGKRQRAAGLEVAFKPAIKAGAAAMGHLLGGLFGPGNAGGNGPTVGVLLCQGAARYGVCHYMFFRRDQLGDCIRLCQTSLGCFTDICMPMTISWEDANGFSMRQFGP